MIAITGASGHLGRLVITQLLEKVPAQEIVALVRTPSKVVDLAERGVVVREADYRKTETLDPALAGVKKLLLISSSDFDDRAGQHRRVLEAAKKAGVEHVVYTSILRGVESPLILAADHATTERLIETLGVPFTILRNGWYHENYLGNLEATFQHGVVGSSGNGRISGAPRADYAAAAVAVLTGSGHEGKRYELGGDTSFTKAELAAALTKVSGRQVSHAEVPPETFQQILIGAGLPELVASIYVNADVRIAEGALQEDSKTLSRLIGRPTGALDDSIRVALERMLPDSE